MVNEDVLIDKIAVISWSVKAWKGLWSGGSVPSGETLNYAMHHYVTHTHTHTTETVPSTSQMSHLSQAKPTLVRRRMCVCFPS